MGGASETMIQEMLDIWTAIFSGDSWEMRQAFRRPGAWPFGLAVTLVGAVAIHLLYRFVPFVEKYLELSVMIASYLLIAAIIFVTVILRQGFNESFAWATTVPPFLFLVMTWFGCSYNVSKRSHLAFIELRMNLPRPLQLATLTLDMLLWVTMSWVVVVTASRMVLNSAANFAILIGTDNVLQWWFLTAVPISFLFLAARAVGVWLDDIERYRRGDSLVNPVAIGSD